MISYTVVLDVSDSGPGEEYADDVLILASPREVRESGTLWDKLRGRS